MEKKINNTLLFTAKDGTQMVFKVLFTFHSETFDKDYAIFYNEADEEQIIVYAFDENNVLSFVERDEEYEEIDRMVDAFAEEQAMEELAVAEEE